MAREQKRTAAPETANNFLSVSHVLLQAMDEVRSILVATAYQIPEVEQSEAVLKNLVTFAFNSAHGVQVGTNEAELEFFEDDLNEINAHIAGASEKLRESPRWLLSNPKHQNRGDDAPEAVPYTGWSLRHRIEYPILWATLPAMLAASFLSAKAALLASGLPVYLDNLILTSAVAAIPGFGALMLKSMGSLFQSDKAQKAYASVIYGFAAAALGVWAVTFADSFHGTGGGSFDIFSDKPVWKEKLLVGAQIAFEFAAGTAIFLRIEKISKVYDPDTWFENLEHVGQEQIVQLESQNRVPARADVAGRRGLKISQNAALNLQVEMALASLRAKRARGNEPTL